MLERLRNLSKDIYHAMGGAHPLRRETGWGKDVFNDQHLDAALPHSELRKGPALPFGVFSELYLNLTALHANSRQRERPAITEMFGVLAQARCEGHLLFSPARAREWYGHVCETMSDDFRPPTPYDEKLLGIPLRQIEGLGQDGIRTVASFNLLNIAKTLCEHPEHRRTGATLGELLSGLKPLVAEP